MKKTRKYLSLLLLMSVFFLCACSTYANKSYTFNVSTGEQIEVTLNVKEGYDLSQENGQFTVSDKDGNDTMQQQIDANYYRIKNEVKQIVADEIERIKADPELSHLIKNV